MTMGDGKKTTRQLIAPIPKTDKEALYDPQNVEILVASIQEGFRTCHLGVAGDDILVSRDWSFDLNVVRPPFDIWHGDADVNVLIHAGQNLD
jgi:hypothetical protein